MTIDARRIIGTSWKVILVGAMTPCKVRDLQNGKN